MANDSRHVDVEQLSEFRAQLARARRENRVDALVSQENAALLVPRLPVQEIYFTIKEVGLADSIELVALASPTQLRGCIDLDAWQRDTLDAARVEPWLSAALEVGPEKLASVIEGLDPELTALFIRRTCRVYDLSLEDPVPDEPEGNFFPTPDGFFLVDIVADTSERSKAVERLIDNLYRADMQLARHVLMSARSEMTSELEEWSYRWRKNRLGDLGYVDYYDALSVYAAIDPASVRLDEHTREPRPAESEPELDSAMPTGLLATIDQRLYFARALATIHDGDELERLEALVMLLANKAMSADLVEPGDVEAAQRTLERALGYLSIGLEYLVRQQPGLAPGVDAELAAARTALGNVAPERLFRLGNQLVTRLQSLAATLVERGLIKVAPAPLPLVDGPWAELLLALVERRPLFPRSLDGQTGAARPFTSLADIRRAAAALEEVAQIGPWIFGLLVPDRAAFLQLVADTRRLTPPEALRYGTLARSAAAAWMLDGTLRLRAIHPRERRRLLAGPPPSREALGAAFTEAAAAAGLPGQPSGVIDGLARRGVEDPRVIDGLARRGVEDPRVIDGLARRGVEDPRAIDGWLDAWLGGWPQAWSAPGGLFVRRSWLR